MKNWLIKIFGALVISSYLATPFSAWAANLPITAHDNLIDLGSGNVPSTPPPPPPDQRLQQTRQEDKEKCELESKNKNALSKLRSAANPQSLQNVLDQGLGQKLGDNLNNLWRNRIPELLSQQMRQRLPAMVRDGLGRQLPSFVSNELGNRYAAGESSDALRAAFPAIVAQGVRTLLPGIIRTAVTQLVPQAMEEDLPEAALTEIQNTVPEIINESNIPVRVREVLATTTDAFPSLDGKFSEAEMDAASSATVNEISDYAIEGIANSDGFNQLIGDISNQAESMMAPILEHFMNASYGDRFGAYSGGSWSPQTLDEIFDIGTGGIFRGFSIEQELFNPLFEDMGNYLTDATVGGIRDWQISSAIASGASDGLIMETVPGATLGGISSLRNDSWIKSDPMYQSFQESMGGVDPGSSMPGFEKWSANDPMFQSYTESMGLGGQTNVLSNTANLGQTAAGKFDWTGLGNDLKGSFAGGVGDMVGGLIEDNVPFVGGILGSITDKYLTQTLNQLMGVGAAGKTGATASVATAGMTSISTPSADMPFLSSPDLTARWVGLGMLLKAIFWEISADMVVSNQNTGETSGNTKKLNSQTDTMIDQDQKRNNVLVEACTYEKSSNRVALNLEKYFFILAPDSFKAAYLASKELWNGPIRKLLATGYKTANAPGAEQNKNGQPMVGNLPDVIKDDQTEVRRKKEDQVKNSGHWAGEQVSTLLKRVNQANSSKPGVTKKEMETARDPQKMNELSSYEQADLLARAWTPGNSEASFFTQSLGKQMAEEEKADQDARTKFIANNGFLDSRICQKMGEGFCEAWLTLTPGSFIGEIAMKAALLGLDYLTSGAYQSEGIAGDVGKQIAGLGNIAQNPATNQVVQNSQTVGQDPCPGPEPCPKSGWQGGQISANAINSMMEAGVDNAFNALDNLDFEGGSGSTNNGGGFDWGNIDFNLPIPSVNPIINYFRQTEDGTKIEWSSYLTYRCEAKNDWEGTPYKTGDSLINNGGVGGEINLELSAPHGDLTYVLECLGLDDTPVSQSLIIPSTP